MISASILQIEDVATESGRVLVFISPSNMCRCFYLWIEFDAFMDRSDWGKRGFCGEMKRVEACSLSTPPPLFHAAPCFRTTAAITGESSVLLFCLRRCRVDLSYFDMKIAAQPAGLHRFSDFFFSEYFWDLQKHLSRISGFYPRKQRPTLRRRRQHRTDDKSGSKYSFRRHVPVKSFSWGTFFLFSSLDKWF